MTGISVVIPTYNRAALIGETLEAALGQTPAPSEVIVVDDGSTDDTPQRLAAWGDRVRVLCIPNSGDMVGRNVGLRAAASRLVAFCDSDDLWQPGHLAEMARLWALVPGLGAAYSNFRTLQDGSVSSADKFAGAPARFFDDASRPGEGLGVFDRPVVDRLLAFQPFFPSCMVVDRTAFLALGGYDEGVSRVVGCDLATALRVAARPPLGFVEAPTVLIRKHAGNISADVERMNLGDAQVLCHVLATRSELAPLAGLFRRSISARRAEALDSAFGRRDFAAVRTIAGLDPAPRLDAKRRAKIAIATLPAGAARGLAGLLSR